MTVTFDLTEYSQDFAYEFDRVTENFIQFFNLMPMGQGTLIKGQRAEVTLAEDMKHEAGTEISDSQVRLYNVDIAELDFDATKVDVSYQDIQKYGQATAIGRKDQELLNKLGFHIENSLIGNMTEFSEKSTTATDFKKGLATARGELESTEGFKGSSAVAFVNTMDYFNYLRDADVATAQNLFGMNYVENFLGYDVIFYTNELAEGEFFVTGAGNLNLAHIPASGAAFSSIGLTPSENDLIAVKHYLNDDTGDIMTKAQFGLEAFAERVDAVVKVTIEAPAEGVEA